MSSSADMNAILFNGILMIVSFASMTNCNFTYSENETYISETSINDSFYSDGPNDIFSFNETDVYYNVTENTTLDLEPSDANKLTPEWTDDSTVTKNSLKDENLCTCDLISSVCEVNCCCDPDCDKEDIKVFTECIPQQTTVDPKYCYRTNVFYKNNTIFKGVLDPDNQLFCIVRDNLRERFRFNEIPSYESVQDFHKLYKTDTFSWNFQSKSHTFGGNLKAGSALFLKSVTGYVQSWSIPFHCFSRTCDCSKSVAYLEDVTSSCLVIINNLKAECKTKEVLSADYYVNFCIESITTSNTSQLISVNGAEEFNETEDMGNRNYFLNNGRNCLTGHNYRKPSYSASSKTCKNVVTSVQYTVVHSGVEGIQSFEVRLEFGTIDARNSSFVQEFGVAFQWNDTNLKSVVKRSGNPGYQIGLPIIAGSRSNVSGKIPGRSFVKLLEKGLTVVSSHSSGSCNDVRETLKFGQNLQTGCTLKTIIRSCQKTQDQVLNFLMGTSEVANFVAAFGNPNVTKLKDWVEVFHDGSNPNDRNAVNSENSNVCDLILGLDIDIAFAAVGATINPQYKIVGVIFQYHSKIPVCCISVESSLHLSTSVNFFDVSEAAIPVFKNIPVFKAKLPHDFFYPFLLSNAHNFQCHYMPSIVLFMLMLVIYL